MPKNRRRKNHRNKNKINNSNSNNNDNNKSNQNNIEEKSNISDGVIDVDADEEREHVIEETQQQQHQLRYLQQENEKEESETNSNTANSQEEQSIRELSGNYVGDHPTCISRGGGGGKQEENENILPSCSLQEESNPSEEDENKNNKDQYTHTDDSSCINNDAPNREHDPKYSNKLAETFEELSSPNAATDTEKIAGDELVKSNDNEEILSKKETNKNNENCLKNISSVTKNIVNLRSEKNLLPGNDKKDITKTGTKLSKENAPPEAENSTEETENSTTTVHESSTSSSFISSSSDTDTLKGEELSSSAGIECDIISIDSRDLHDDITKDQDGKNILKSNSESSINNENILSPKSPSTPIKHPIIQEAILTLYSYRVESPKPMKLTKPLQMKKSRSLDDDDVTIQEISDNSSAGDLTDSNQPLVSEAESEAETVDTENFEPVKEKSSTQSQFKILNIQTIPLGNEKEAEITVSRVDNKEEISANEGHVIHSTVSLSLQSVQEINEKSDVKARRAKKRAAIESHFMPQFLNPRYLDSIKEENSDISDCDRKSDPREDHDFTPLSRSNSDDVVVDSAKIAKKANAIFPKINLDLSTCPKKRISNIRSPKTDAIREESPCLVVEAKIIEQKNNIQESCSSWTTKEAPEPTAAEIVYIDSASSSSSDLMDLDYTGGDEADTEDTHDNFDVEIGATALNCSFNNSQNKYEIGMKTTTGTSTEEAVISSSVQEGHPPTTESKFSSSNSDSGSKHTQDDFQTSVAIEKSILTCIAGNESKDNEINVENSENDEIIKEFSSPCTTDAVDNSKVQPEEICAHLAEDELLLNKSDYIEESEETKTMDDLDEKFDQVLNENQLVDFDNISCASLITDLDVSSSNLITDLDASSDGGECNENDNNSKNIKDNHEDSPVNNVNGKCKSEGRNSDNDSLEYSRQDSNGSHASTRSQSTTHSQCTTINKGSLSNTDLTAFDNENSIAGPADDNNLINEPNDLTSETASIKSLRQLSLEVLSSMPYGGEVLEELAKVSASLSHLAQQHHNQATSLLDSCCDQDQYQKEGEDMPYPVPELPKIEKLQLPNNVPSDPSKIVNIKFVSTLIKSPSPPPIPSPPREDAWYGIPTEEDPNVLLCLSPSQRDQLEKESNGANRKSVEKLIKPDHLLDMHKKFIERRGYHEPLPPTPQSNEKNAHRKSSTEKCENIMSPINLRKSMTPPPVPPRPGQQLLSSSSLLNVNENEISKSEEKIFSDKNNHRLLAIIRGDSEQSDLRTSENISKKVEHSFGTKETLHKNLVINNKNQSVTRNLSDQTTQTTVKTDLTLSPKKTSSTNTTLTFPSSTENPTKEMPPTIEKDIIFEYLNRENSLKDQLKRCSNIETLSGSGYRDNELCAQLNRPKRYSNIETSSFESKKHIENGNVVYEYNDSNKQKYSDGNCDTPKILENLKINFDELMKKGNRDTCSKDKVNKERFHPQREHREKDVQHEFFQDRYSDQQDFKNRNTLNDQQKTAYLNSTASSTSDAFSYDEFRRRAKETAERARNEFFAREKLFKDFEDISSILKDDMFTINDSTTSTSKYKTAETSTGTPKIPNIPIEEDESKLWKEFHDKVSSTATTTKEEKKHFVEKTERKTFQIPIKVEGEFSSNILKNVPGESFNEQKEFVDKFMSQQQRHVASQPQLRNLENKKHLDSKVYEIPMNIEEKSSIGSELNSTEQTEETHRVRTIPILMERSYSLQDSCKGHRERVIPIQVETTSKVFHSQPNTPSPYYENFMVHSKTTPTSPISPTLLSRQEKIFAERKLSNQDVSECIRYTDDLGSSENITRPFWKEMTICHGRRANVRAPRLTASTSNLSNSRDYLAKSTEQLIDKKDRYISCHSVIDQTPITQHVSNSKRSSVPRELYSTSNTAASNNSQIDYLKQREYELKVEFEKLENERRRLMQEMEEMNTKKLHKDSALYHSIGGRLPVLSEEEAFRKQMHNEWLDKVAEREERRLQKIIKISKPANEVGASSVETPSLSHNVNTVYQQSSLEKNKILKSASNLDISDEFLRRVKERRTKLCMPSDSEWDSGAESQQPTTETSQQQQSEDEIKNVKIIEGQTETDLKHLPKHLREFVEFTNKIEKEHCNDNETKNDVNQQQQFNRKEFVKSENNNSSLIQRNEKSSIFTKTVKTSMFNGNCDDKNNCESFDKKSSIKNSGPERNDAITKQESDEKFNSSVSARSSSFASSNTIHENNKNVAHSKTSSSDCKKIDETRKSPVALTRKRNASTNTAQSSIHFFKENISEEITSSRSSRASATASTTTSTSTTKRRKQTRFLLTPDRRSWSESDLLREIDNDLILSKGFLYGFESQPVMFAPKFNAKTLAQGPTTTERDKQAPTPTPPTPPPLPVWSPQPSPTLARKEFRPVKFQSPVLPRRYTRETSASAVAPPWTAGGNNDCHVSSSSCSNLNSLTTNTSEKRLSSSTSNLAQQIKSADSPFGRLAKNEYPRPVKSNEYIYSVRQECFSEPETDVDRPRRIMTQVARKKFEGIGPTTKDGMPIVLRSEVKEDNQHQWYKRMYNTLHKAKDGDEYVTIRYKCPRGRYLYKTNGYMSEPEPNYDSDYSTMKYNTLDRKCTSSKSSYQQQQQQQQQQTQQHKDDSFPKSYGTMPNPVKSGSPSYKNQPGRIEDYVPGRSSVSEKEKKEWWDEVMEIFNGHLEQQKLSNNYTEGYLSRALKEQGYESDSNLVFRKKEDSQFAPLSPIEQKQAYRNVQAGGEPPLQGFRKPAPEKPKADKEDDNIEYYPITSTLTKIRVHDKNAILQKPPKEIICYPITSVSRPLDLFAPFPKNVPSFIPLNPTPPPRYSSKTATTTAANTKSSLRIYSSSSQTRNAPKRPSSHGRHEACFKTDYHHQDGSTLGNKYATMTLRKHSKPIIEPYRSATLMRSKSAGPICSSTKYLGTGSLKEPEHPKTTHISRKQTYHLSSSSISPLRHSSSSGKLSQDFRKSSPSPVAFGRSISKERSFAEEKKRLEETLPLSRKAFTASTNILRDPSLKSPDEVKRAVRSYATAQQMSRKGTSLRSTSFTSSTLTKRNYDTPSKLKECNRKEEKSTKILSITSKSAKDDKRKQSIDAPKTIKTNLHSTHFIEKRNPKEMTKTSSTLSLARTSSTFSVDSSGSKKRHLSKKPHTISRSMSREKNTTPLTIHGGQSKIRQTKSPPKQIMPSKSDSNILRKIHSSIDTSKPEKIVEKIEKDIRDAIIQHQEAVRSDTFFQNLFLRDSSPIPSSLDSTLQQTTSVQERTKYWNTLASRHDSISRRRCPYLTQKRPVTGSKFLTMEKYYQSRSLSPNYRLSSPRGRRIRHQVSKFDPYYQLSDDESEFGEREEVFYKYEHRSNSEPRPIKKSGEIWSVESAENYHHYQEKSNVDYPRIFTPTREVRSPSRRRIESFRETQKSSETKKVIRASSLSSADERSRKCHLYECGELSHSAGSLHSLERHGPQCRLRSSDRFVDLNKFYSNIERVGQLERATSSTDLHPIRREGEIIDFDEWKKIRAHERAEKELNYLVDKLKRDQRERDFVFRPKDVEDVKWKEYSDSGLRCKEKSVEDLRESFEKKIFEEGLDEAKKFEISAEKDIYKPYWRGTSVTDSATNMVAKYNSRDTRSADERHLCLSNRLISTLSKDQVNKIKHQLSEIYTSPSPRGRGEKCELHEDYIITVDDEKKNKSRALKVRCNSSMSKEEMLSPVLKRKESYMAITKSESTTPTGTLSLPPKPPPFPSGMIGNLSKHFNQIESELTEIEKKQLSQSLSREVQDKVLERKSRTNSPVLLARETRGAILAEQAKRTLPEPFPHPCEQEYYSLEYETRALQENGRCSRDTSLEKKTVNEKRTFRSRKPSVGETESNESDISKTTVIYKEKHLQSNKDDGIKDKIKYFEEKKKEEPPKTIYHAREYSSPDEEEVMKAIEEKMKAKEREANDQQNTTTSILYRHKELSSSAADLKELFGERETSRINFPMPRLPPSPGKSFSTMNHHPEEDEVNLGRTSLHKSSSLTFSNDSIHDSTYYYRSRSTSPLSEYKHKSHLSKISTGDVKKIKDKFESLHRSTTKKHHSLKFAPLRQFRSDPEINNYGKFYSHKITIRDHETGDVSWITHKFESKNSAAIAATQSTRGRSRKRRVISPVLRNFNRKEDRLMPHIDIISKTASLKQELVTKSPSPILQEQQSLHTGEVERIRCKFESPERQNRPDFKTSTSILGEMFTSSPDIRELKDISNYLSASWIAHKYPKPRDNARSPTTPEKGPESEYVKRRDIHYYQQHLLAEDQKSKGQKGSLTKHPRSLSTSPPRIKSLATSILRPYYDIFADQKFDPLIHRPKARYIPVVDKINDLLQQTKKKKGQNGYKKTAAVKFEESEAIPLPPPAKDATNNVATVPSSREDKFRESPHRYFESDVNIHYKTPIRYEYKETIPEEELSRRQAEAMKKLYQEERRRKYLQELQDMNNRRHTDNFTPTQKSPIPLNRYDDFNADLPAGTTTSGGGYRQTSSSSSSKTVARALYNFQGQTARELSFKKGDIIYIRRQVDKNWYEGEHNAMIGLLPANYVEVISKDGSRQTPKKLSEGQARAKFSFQAQSGIELSLNKGELVTLTRRVDENWFEGRIANRKGIFPVSYVEVLTDIGSEDFVLQNSTTLSSKPVGTPASHSLITYPLTPQQQSLDTIRTNLNNELNALSSSQSHHHPTTNGGIIKEMKTIHKTQVLHVDTDTEPVAYRALYKYRPQNNDELELQEGDIVYVLEKCDDGWYVGTSQRTGYFGTFPGNYVERV